MAETAPTLGQMAPHLIPKRWASAPMERARQMEKIQMYLAAETYYAASEESSDFGIEFHRGMLMHELGIYYGGLTDPIGQIGDWIVENVYDPLVDLIEGLADTWPFSLISDAWDAVSDITGWVPDLVDWLVDKGLDAVKALMDTFWDFISDPVGTVQDAISGIWDTLTSVGGALWDTITDAATGAVNYIWGGIKDTLGDAWDAIKDFGNSVFKYAKQALDAALDPLWSIIEAIKNYIGYFWEKIKDAATFIGDLPGKIWTKVQEVWGWVETAINNIWGSIQDAAAWLGKLPGEIGSALEDLGTWIYDGLMGAFEWLQEDAWPWVVSTMDNIWHVVLSGVNWIAGRIMDVWHGVVHTFANFAHIVTDAIVGGLKKVLVVITEPLGEFFKWCIQSLVVAPLQHKRGVGGTIPFVPDFIDTIGDVAQELYATLRDGVSYEPPATPEKAEDAAGDFLTYGIIFGGMDSIITMAEELWDKLRGFSGGMGGDILNKIVGYAETLNPFQQYPKMMSNSTAAHFGGIAKFFKSTYYALGLGFMMWTIWSGTLRACMSDPREDYYRRYYKTIYPTRSQFMDAFQAQMSTPTSNEGWLEDGGFSPLYRQMVIDTSWKRLTESKAKELWKRRLISIADIMEESKYWGYRREIRPKVVQNILMEARREKYDDVVDAVQDGYKDGIFDRETAIRHFRSHGLRDMESQWYTYALDIETQIEDAEEFIDAIDKGFNDKLDNLADAFEDGRIEESEFQTRREELEDEYRHRLAQYMRRAERVEAKIMYWKNKNLPEQIPIAVKPLKERIEDMEQEIENKKYQRAYLIERRKETKETYTARAKVLKERMSGDARELLREISAAKDELLRDLRGKRADYADDVARAVAAQSEELANAVTVPWTAVVNQLQMSPDPEPPKPTLTDEFFRRGEIPIPPSTEERVNVVMGWIADAIETQAPALIEQIRTDIFNLKDEYRSDIAELQARLEAMEPMRTARLEEMAEEEDDTLLYYDNRISKLERSILEQEEELEAMKRALPPAS